MRWSVPWPIKAFALFASAFLVGALIRPVIASVISPQVAASTVGPERLNSGPELIIMYLARSTCTWCRRPETKQLAREIMDSLSRRGHDLGWRVKTVGVSMDMDPQLGWEHLREVGTFDELSVGGGWLNETAMRPLWQTPGVERAGTPMLVAYVRLRDRAIIGSGLEFREVVSAPVLALNGVTEMTSWVAGGGRVRPLELALERAFERSP